MSVCSTNTQIAQLGGIAFALTISGSVFVNTAIEGLSRLLPNATHDELQLALSGTSGAFFQQLDESLQADATSVIVAAMSQVYLLVYVAAAFCLIASVCFTVSNPMQQLRRDLLTIPISNARCSRTQSASWLRVRGGIAVWVERRWASLSPLSKDGSYIST